LHWAGSKDELREEFPNVDDYEIMSVTFIPALLDDNPVLLAKDPGYRARLNALPRIERERLLGGNWKTSEGSQISRDWLRRYVANQAEFHFTFQDHFYKIPIAKCRRIATIDTAGTSKEKAAAQKGKEPSWSVCAVWDSLPSISLAIDGRSVVLSELLFLRYVWRKRVDWSRLVEGVDETLETWNVTKAYIENAHHGSALAKQLRSSPCELIGPIIAGMGDRSEGAKLERAIASGMLARWEHGKVFVPTDPSDWLQAYLAEIFGWQGKPDEPADQIDVTSYAAYISKRSSGAWGGVIKKG
jgi:phage terminase large subunit-like protein